MMQEELDLLAADLAQVVRAQLKDWSAESVASITVLVSEGRLSFAAFGEAMATGEALQRLGRQLVETEVRRQVEEAGRDIADAYREWTKAQRADREAAWQALNTIAGTELEETELVKAWVETGEVGDLNAQGPFVKTAQALADAFAAHRWESLIGKRGGG